MPSASRNTDRLASQSHDALSPDALAPTELDPTRTLASRIRDRILKRLEGRVHNLRVSTEGKTILIEGRCATYYSKQLAQHAALGVIEDEHVENAIEVTIAR